MSPTNATSKPAATTAGVNAGARASSRTPNIVEKVNKIPMVNFAISMGFSQYDKLKSSNVTVGEVMTKAEDWALFVWSKVQPIVDKLQEPIKKADQLACQTFDFVEDKLSTVHMPQSPLTDSIITKLKQVAVPLASSVTGGKGQQAAVAKQ